MKIGGSGARASAGFDILVRGAKAFDDRAVELGVDPVSSLTRAFDPGATERVSQNVLLNAK